MTRLACLLLALLAALSSGCVSFPQAPERLREAVLEEDAIIVRDGARLAYTAWAPEAPRAVVIALHGMNDYANAFALAAPYWRDQAEIATIAYDQRGFGRNASAGSWPGAATLRSDLVDVVAAVGDAYPGLPIYLLGHSMGGAVALSAAREQALDVDGVILAAPAVWGAGQMSPLYRLSANVAAVFAPGKTLTGERAGRQATDNIDVLRAMAADENVLKETRIDSVLGLVRLMGDGWRASERVTGDFLFLYGEKDDIVPVKTMEKARARLCGPVTAHVYAEGWHMLLRDLQAENVWRDIANFIIADQEDEKGRHGLRGGSSRPVTSSVCRSPEITD